MYTSIITKRGPKVSTTYRPQKIVDMEKLIEDNARALELRMAILGPGSVTLEDIGKVIDLLRDLQVLHIQWRMDFI